MSEEYVSRLPLNKFKKRRKWALVLKLTYHRINVIVKNITDDSASLKTNQEIRCLDVDINQNEHLQALKGRTNFFNKVYHDTNIRSTYFERIKCSQRVSM